MGHSTRGRAGTERPSRHGPGDRRRRPRRTTWRAWELTLDSGQGDDDRSGPFWHSGCQTASPGSRLTTAARPRGPTTRRRTVVARNSSPSVAQEGLRGNERRGGIVLEQNAGLALAAG